MTGKTNIIYFNPDEMRGSLMGCMGHPLIKTPNFDRLAKAGTLFTNCHVQNTVCSPSRCSFMTGTYVHNSGHRTLWNLLQPYEENTMKYFKDAGYDVQMMGKNDLFSPGALEQSVNGFLQMPEITGGGRTGKTRRPANGNPHYDSFLYEALDDEETHETFFLENAISYLRSRRDQEQPFFLFMPWGMPHCPYTCPEPWYSMYASEDIPDFRPADLPDKPMFYNMIRETRKLDQLSQDELKKIMAVYLGMISYVDHLFGKLLDALVSNGLWDNTAIFFFSDHGDWAGDYGLVEKWPSGMDDCLTHIPMIVKTPGGQGGHVVDAPIACFDIMPTSLELGGIECRHTHFARSMTPQLSGSEGDEDRAVFCEGGYNPNEPHCFEGFSERDATLHNPDSIYFQKIKLQQTCNESVCRATMLRTRTHKYVCRSADTDELYDLVHDPCELTNEISNSAYADILAELKDRMLRYYLDTADIIPFAQDGRGFPCEHRLGRTHY